MSNQTRAFDHAQPAENAGSQPAAKKPATVVYACSGCSDAGELADRVARRLTREGLAQMSCLAGIGGRVKSLVAKAESAERILVIDGCPLVCAKKTLQLAGFNEFEHLGLHEAGLRKGSCPVTEENITVGLKAAKTVLEGIPEEPQLSGAAGAEMAPSPAIPILAEAPTR